MILTMLLSPRPMCGRKTRVSLFSVVGVLGVGFLVVMNRVVVFNDKLAKGCALDVLKREQSAGYVANKNKILLGFL